MLCCCGGGGGEGGGGCAILLVEIYLGQYNLNITHQDGKPCYLLISAMLSPDVFKVSSVVDH